MNRELWRWITDYEGLYLISNHGRVMSVPKTIRRSDNSMRSYDGQVLKQNHDTNGYPIVVLSNNGRQKTFKVHRLVACAFIENPLHLSQVNHIDENKDNNCVDNLEWCENKYNSNYGTRNKRVSAALSKRVIMLDTNKRIIEEYNSTLEAELHTGVQCSHISECCRGIRRTAGGYLWQYID